MVNFVTLFEATQNSDGVFNTWLADIHLLESTFKGRIFFDVLTIFIKSSCANHAQLTSGQHGLNHVAGVHGTFSATCTHNGV